MKIGSEYDSSLIGLTEFELLAEETKLSKPIVKRRVLELAELTRFRLGENAIDNPAVGDVARIVEANCKRALGK